MGGFLGHLAGGLVPGFGGGGLKSLLLGPGMGPSLSLFNKLSAQQEQLLQKQLGLGQVGIGALTRGFEGGSAAIKQASGVAKTDARDTATQATAGATTSAVDRGIYNTSTLDAANRGIGSDLARHLAAIDAMAGEQQSGLELGKASALQGAYGQQAGLLGQFGQSQMQLANPLFSQLGNQHGILGPLLQGLGTFAGAGGKS